jgi:hypothetical protein
MKKKNIMEGSVDWNFLNNVIENIKNIDKKDMMTVTREIYEATYYRYAMMYHKAKAEKEDIQALMIKKTERIDALMSVCETLFGAIENKVDVSDEALKQLKEFYEKNAERARISEASEKGITINP